MKVDNNKATTNYIVIYGGDIQYQREILCTKTQGNNLRYTWLLFVNVIQKFWKVVQMCVQPCIQAGHKTQLFKISIVLLKLGHQGSLVLHQNGNLYAKNCPG